MRDNGNYVVIISKYVDIITMVAFDFKSAHNCNYVLLTHRVNGIPASKVHNCNYVNIYRPSVHHCNHALFVLRLMA